MKSSTATLKFNQHQYKALHKIEMGCTFWSTSHFFYITFIYKQKEAVPVGIASFVPLL